MDFKIVGIMACDPGGIISMGSKIPWKIKSETQHFLKTVNSSPLIMGRKTYDSLPLSLKQNHQCIVFSRKLSMKSQLSKNSHIAYNKYAADIEPIFISSIEEFRKLKLKDKVFMIGGAEIARLFLESNMISEFILSLICEEYEGDTKLDLNLFKNWSKSEIYLQKEFKVYKFLPPLNI